MTKFTKQEIEFARKASIVDYCNAAGIELKKDSHDGFKGVDHDSLTITPSKNMYFWNSQGVHGRGALNFVIDYELIDDTDDSDNVKFIKAMKKIMAVKDQLSIEGHVETPKKDPFDPDSMNIDPGQNRAAFTYLHKARGISLDTLTKLYKAGLIMQTKPNQYNYVYAAFPWRNPLKPDEIRGCSWQGLESIPGKRSYKQIVKNSETGYAFYFDDFDSQKEGITPTHLRFFESEIDAISYYDLSIKAGKPLKDTRFIAMDGLKKENFISYLQKAVKALANEKKQLSDVALGVDNDDAGQKFYNEVHGIANKIKNAMPNKRMGKDWNDALKTYNKVKHINQQWVGHFIWKMALPY